MRRALVPATLALLAAAASPAAAAPERPALGARVTACTTGDQPSSRAATFTASMPAIAGTRRMWMRFELRQRRVRGQGFRHVDVPGWDVWEKSQIGRPGFIYSKRVEGLLAPAAYRAVVKFRWYGRHGRLLRVARRVTKPCDQPDPRANLLAGKLTGRRGADKDHFVYEWIVRNDGRGTAAPFGVVITVNGQPQTAVTLGPLAPGSREIARVTAPRCEPGSKVLIAIDPDSVVDEAREDDNTASRPCPFGDGGAKARRQA